MIMHSVVRSDEVWQELEGHPTTEEPLKDGIR
jgi:hypothetical protein